MSCCGQCRYFFAVPENADDYRPGKGDCVTEKEDHKGKYWTSKPVFQNDPACEAFTPRR